MRKTPLILTVPGLNNSGPDHWQTWWEETRENCRRIDLGHWSLPVRNVWVSRIEQSVMSVDRPVILVGHSLGCHAIAWWATLNGQASAPSPVVGALLVAPPEVDSRFVGVPLRNFAPSPVAPFRFPTTLVASQDDPFAHPRRSRRLAERWQSRFVDVGKKGHINAVSGLGFWDEGQAILDELIERALPEPASTPPSLKRGASAS